MMQDSMDKMQNDIVQIKGDIAENKSGIKALQRDVADICLTLENETNKNIMRNSEGYSDLSRKLDEALEIDNEKEMMAIRLTIQENELRRLKDKVDQIA